MAKHRTHSVEFKKQVSQEYLSGETLHALAKRHNISRNLIRIWVEKFSNPPDSVVKIESAFYLQEKPLRLAFRGICSRRTPKSFSRIVTGF